MKKVILILILLAAAPLFSQPFGGGLGTESSPYEIYTKAHLEELADSVNSGNNYFEKYFKVMNDIYEPVTKPIGYYLAGYGTDSLFSFSGNFNGQGYKIKLNIENMWSSSMGLFVSISNATIINLIVDGYVKGRRDAGAIVGMADTSIILNCLNLARVNGEGGFTGGIAGVLLTNCRVSFCLNIGKIEGVWCVGGIVGHSGRYEYNGNNNNIVYNSENSGYIKGIWGVGGIVGHLGNYNDNSNTTIIHCINVGSVEGIERDGIGYIDPPEGGIINTSE